MTPDVFFHALAGATGIFSGGTALFTRKGGRVHRTAGKVFFFAMITAAVSAMWLAWKTTDYGTLTAAVLILYLLATGWMTVRRKPRQTGVFEIVTFLLVAAGSVAVFLFTLQSVQAGTALLGGIPGFIFSAVAAVAAGLDLSVILRRGLSARQRIARHLWRTHVGLFAAFGSFFPGQLQFFPEFIQQIRPTILLFIPAFLIIGLMFFWLARLFFTGWFAKKPIMANPSPTPPT
jgi:uncharacterized membrane protein